MRESETIIFVQDFFADELVGGAELSSQTLMEKAPCAIKKVHAIDVDDRLIYEHRDSFWIFGNFTRMKYSLLPEIWKYLRYAVIEYDYKFCIYRSTELHQIKEGRPCDCHRFFGKTIAEFYSRAAVVFWMSERQKTKYINLFPQLDNARCLVLSSVFDEDSLREMAVLRVTSDDRRGWLVLNYGSWIKGVEDSLAYGKEHDLDVRVVQKMKHRDLLKQLSKSRGLIFLPKGDDSCPRLPIEAKLCGCDLIINDHVQQRGEEWFSKDADQIERYLRSRPGVFWKAVQQSINNKEVCYA